MTQLCVKCRTRLGDSGDEVTARALKHWIDHHHGSDLLVEVLSDVWVRIDCSGCGYSFYSPVSHGPGRLAAEAYCPECIEEDKLLKIYAREIKPAVVLACQADPTESLGDTGDRR